MNILISFDEDYPVFGIEKVNGPLPKCFEIPDELVERYGKAKAEWDAVQAILRDLSGWDNRRR